VTRILAGNRIPARGLAARLALIALAAAPAAAVAIPASYPVSVLVADHWTTRDGLPVSAVLSLSASATGYLWLATEEGLARFDGVRFTVLDRAPLPMPSVRLVREDRGGALWAGTHRGLAVRRGARFEPVSLAGRAEADVATIADDPGGVWVGTDAGLFRVQAGGRAGERDPRFGEASALAALSDGEGGVWVGGPDGLAHLPASGPVRRIDRGALGGPVRALAARPGGGLWIGGSGLFRLDETGDPVPVAGSGALRITALLVDGDGVLWVAAWSGVYRLVKDALEPVPLGAREQPPIVALADDGGGIWVGTLGGGLFRLHVGTASTIGADAGLASDDVSAILEAGDGTIWIASNGGVDRLRGREIAHVAVPLRPGERAYALAEDPRGGIWVGAEGRLLHEDAGRWREVPAASGLDAGYVRAVLVDDDGDVWAGSAQGLYRVERDRLVEARDERGEPVRAAVAAFARTPAGEIWVCGPDGVGPLAAGRFRPLAGTRGCFGMSAGADGTLWVGQVERGLLRIRGGQFQRFSRAEGLLEDSVLAALEDGRGGLWLTGNHGVQRIALEALDAVAEGRARTVAPLHYGTSDGMADPECNGMGSPNAWRGADGRLWFPTAKGAVVFDPVRRVPLPRPPRVQIEEVLVDGAPVEAAGELRLPPGTRRVAIRYTGLAPDAPDRLRFRIRLAGLDDQEVDAGAERTVQYAGLPPGRYQFSVRALRERGVESERPAELTFVIEPRFWRTSWFVAALGLVLVLLALAADEYRVRGARLREAELRVRVAQETAKVKVLSGLLPVCAGCNSLRVEDGGWQRLDAYVADRSAAKVAHVMCPACAARLEPGAPR
jgi:ligand-binding sensor domain-containing protein